MCKKSNYSSTVPAVSFRNYSDILLTLEVIWNLILLFFLLNPLLSISIYCNMLSTWASCIIDYTFSLFSYLQGWRRCNTESMAYHETKHMIVRQGLFNGWMPFTPKIVAMVTVSHFKEHRESSELHLLNSCDCVELWWWIVTALFELLWRMCCHLSAILFMDSFPLTVVWMMSTLRSICLQ